MQCYLTAHKYTLTYLYVSATAEPQNLLSMCKLVVAREAASTTTAPTAQKTIRTKRDAADVDEHTFEPEEDVLPERGMLPEAVEDAVYSEEVDDQVTSFEDLTEETDDEGLESDEASGEAIDADEPYDGNSVVDDYGDDEDKNFP